MFPQVEAELGEMGNSLGRLLGRNSPAKTTEVTSPGGKKTENEEVLPNGLTAHTPEQRIGIVMGSVNFYFLKFLGISSVYLLHRTLSKFVAQTEKSWYFYILAKFLCMSIS